VDERLDRWLDLLLATPGLTSIRDRAEARRVHVEESLGALGLVERFPGRIADIGSGGGAPGIPLAASLPDRAVTLVEANGRKCAFLRDVARELELPNVTVVHGRAEEQERERFGVALAKALAPPPVAAEWCLPLVAVGGAAILFVGPSADLGAVACAAAQLGGAAPEDLQGIVVVPKLELTPPRFPRRPGIARKRPLA
jgi:16S rRNA (guanine527-N7)-methyltransferase